MSTTLVSAGQVMDRVANLLNDPNKTDYTYVVVQPYLNMAIEELSEAMEETNNSPSNKTLIFPFMIGENQLFSNPDVFAGGPHAGKPFYPDDLTEIQEIGERTFGTNDSFIRMERKEFINSFPANNSLLYWCWEDQKVKFNPNGALTNRELELRYVSQGIPYVLTPNDPITMANSRAFLSYKTAAFCALFIGENETRAQALDDLADKALERTNAISNKGRQQIMTRHRPFRASYKMRGWI